MFVKFFTVAIALALTIHTGTLRGQENAISVWRDHQNPGLGRIDIPFYLNNTFDPNKKTLFVIHDPLSPLFPKLSLGEEIGEKFNVVTLAGRFQSANLGLERNPENGVNCKTAYQIFQAKQYVHDIEALRKKLVPKGKIMLFGTLSAAYLVHQYISLFGHRVTSAITVDPFLPDLQKAMGIALKKPVATIEEWDTNLPNKVMAYQVVSTVQLANEEALMDQFSMIDQFYIDEKVWKEGSSNVPLQVALFEQIFHYLPISPYEMELLNVVDRWKLELSRNLIFYYGKSVFDVHGIDYDLLKGKKSKVHIISSAFGMYSDQRTSQVLAEYYPNASLYLVNTSHQLKESGLLDPFLLALFSENLSEKMIVYEKLIQAQILFQHKSNPGLEGLPGR